ncbi:MAG: HAD family hydrolase, partial [Bacteroidetes bacterium]
ENNQYEIHFEGKELSSFHSSVIFSVVRHSAHPLSKILADYFKRQDFYELRHFEEFPGKGIRGVLSNNEEVLLGSAEFTGYETATDDNPMYSYVYVKINNNHTGRFAIRKKYREGVEEMLIQLKKQGYDLYLLSGDNESEKAGLQAYFSDNQMRFKCKPEDKLNFLKDLKKQGKKIIMIGDGLNDAGALKQADVGIAVTDDIYNFSPSSDAILKGEEVKNTGLFLAFARTAKKVLISSLILSFIYNIVGISFAITGNVTPVFAAVLMPVSSVTVVGYITLAISFLWRRAIILR